MISTFTNSVKLLCTVPYRYSKCSLNVCKCQAMFSAFTDSVNVTCKVPYRYSKCKLNVTKEQ